MLYLAKVGGRAGRRAGGRAGRQAGVLLSHLFHHLYNTNLQPVPHKLGRRTHGGSGTGTGIYTHTQNRFQGPNPQTRAAQANVLGDPHLIIRLADLLLSGVTSPAACASCRRCTPAGVVFGRGQSGLLAWQWEWARSGALRHARDRRAGPRKIRRLFSLSLSGRPIFFRYCRFGTVGTLLFDHFFKC